MRVNHRCITILVTWAIFSLILEGCRAPVEVIPASTTIPSNPTTDIGGLNPDEVQTLESLEKVSDYPFYVMYYSGGYEYPKLLSLPSDRNPIGCSLFAALGESDDKLYGRNFDWEFSPALLVFTDPPDGYASASMVDLTFLDIAASDATQLTNLRLQERINLLDAPALPFDGMNEYGLAIGMAAVPDEYADDTSYDPARPTIGSIGIMRQVLDHARNVEEAVEIFGQYNVRFSGGPPIHYLLADRSGEAMLIEFYNGQMGQLPNENPWHLATNHLRCIAQGDGGCWRYRTLSEHLTQLNGQLDGPSAMQLLSEVKQESTQWSAIYNVTTGDIQVVVGRDYATSYSFHLELAEQ